MDMDSWTGLVSGRQVLARAGAPFNCDWNATGESVRKLAALNPSVIACGHGIPMTDELVAQRFTNFSIGFRPPRHGRYVRRSARTDERGVVSVPKPPFDPVPFATAAGMLAVGIILGAGWLEDER
jgi:hypothetical protein